MRYSGEHKAETRQRIVRAAARDIRARGPGRIAVAEVMASAGLTHGGFYAHFASKEALVAEAVIATFDHARRRNPGLDDALSEETADVRVAFRDYLAGYLSPDHRDGPERGCPLPSLAADMARDAGPAQANFARGLDRITERIEAVLTRLDVAEPHREASAIVAQMVGAVGLARAVGKGERSDAILSDTLDTLCMRLGL